MTTSDPAGSYHLPGYLVLMIGLAMLILWLSLLAVVVGVVISGTGLNLADIIPRHVDEAMRTALIFQYAVIFLNLLALFIFGNVICILWLASAHGGAVMSTIWLIRLSLVMMFIQIFASNAMPAAVGGAIAEGYLDASCIRKGLFYRAFSSKFQNFLALAHEPS